MSEQPNIEVLAEESHFLLVNKPAGLLSQAAPLVPSLEVELSRQLKHRDQHPGKPFIGLPHRLDRATSGIMLIARNHRALARFSQQFQSRKVNKFYLAVLDGELPPKLYEWEDHLRKIDNLPKAEVVSASETDAKLAQLRIIPVVIDQRRTLAVIQLLTGRMHQIRVQAAHRGYPIIGDNLYGPDAANWLQTPLSSPTEHSRHVHALHSLRIEFRHPQSAKQISGTAPVPEAWHQLGPVVSSAIVRLVQSSIDCQGTWNGLALNW